MLAPYVVELFKLAASAFLRRHILPHLVYLVCDCGRLLPLPSVRRRYHSRAALVAAARSPFRLRQPVLPAPDQAWAPSHSICKAGGARALACAALTSHGDVDVKRTRPSTTAGGLAATAMVAGVLPRRTSGIAIHFKPSAAYRSASLARRTLLI